MNARIIIKLNEDPAVLEAIGKLLATYLPRVHTQLSVGESCMLYTMHGPSYQIERTKENTYTVRPDTEIAHRIESGRAGGGKTRALIGAEETTAMTPEMWERLKFKQFPADYVPDNEEQRTERQRAIASALGIPKKLLDPD